MALLPAGHFWPSLFTNSFFITLTAAAREERFARKKNDDVFPTAAIEYCLREAGIALKDVDHIVFYEKPFLEFERLLETYLAFSPKGFPQSLIPAVTHVNNLARLQMVYKEAHPGFYALINAFFEITGYPMLINTSFNRMDEPIVNTPAEALDCFYNTGMDMLVLENLIIKKPD